MKNLETTLGEPTPGLIDEYKGKWNDLEYYPKQEEVLKDFFENHKQNTDFEIILSKVVLVDKFYSTHIEDPVGIAERIQDLNIDERFKKKDLSLVDDIADYEGAARHEYSFATKYCSWHKPEVYPIFDSNVCGMLFEYNKQYEFTKKFKLTSLGRYQTFCDVYDEFINYFKLLEYTYKDIDQFLWLYGKEKAIKKYVSYIK